MTHYLSYSLSNTYIHTQTYNRQTGEEETEDSSYGIADGREDHFDQEFQVCDKGGKGVGGTHTYTYTYLHLSIQLPRYLLFMVTQMATKIILIKSFRCGIRKRGGAGGHTHRRMFYAQSLILFFHKRTPAVLPG